MQGKSFLSRSCISVGLYQNLHCSRPNANTGRMRDTLAECCMKSLATGKWDFVQPLWAFMCGDQSQELLI